MTTIPLHLPPANFTAAHALLGRLYLEHRAFLRRVLLGQSIPPRDVDDVVQDIFLTAWRRLECLIVPEQARPWLLVIAVVMPYLEGRSIREIAESLGIKTKTAHARLHLAREHLKTLALA
nr:sigma factor-like helix-turn-helix DNA-binding protein [Polyangium fumosum]